MVTLRPMQHADKTYFAQWWRDKDLLATTSGAPPVTKEELTDYFHEMMQGENGEDCMIEVAGQTIGHIAFANRPDGWCELQIVIGNKNFWGKGYGPEAMKQMIAQSKGQNCHKIYLEVWPTHARAIRAYEKAGFVKKRAGELLRMEYVGSVSEVR